MLGLTITTTLPFLSKRSKSRYKNRLPKVWATTQARWDDDYYFLKEVSATDSTVRYQLFDDGMILVLDADFRKPNLGMKVGRDSLRRFNIEQVPNGMELRDGTILPVIRVYDGYMNDVTVKWRLCQDNTCSLSSGYSEAGCEIQILVSKLFAFVNFLSNWLLVCCETSFRYRNQTLHFLAH